MYRQLSETRRERLERLRREQMRVEHRKNVLFAISAVVVAVVLILAAVLPSVL